MPQLQPGTSYTVTVPLKVIPATLPCTVAVSLNPPAGNTVSQSFTSTGVTQQIAMPFITPSTLGTYSVYIQIYIRGILIAETIDPNTVTIVAAQPQYTDAQLADFYSQLQAADAEMALYTSQANGTSCGYANGTSGPCPSWELPRVYPPYPSDVIDLIRQEYTALTAAYQAQFNAIKMIDPNVTWDMVFAGPYPDPLGLGFTLYTNNNSETNWMNGTPVFSGNTLVSVTPPAPGHQWSPAFEAIQQNFTLQGQFYGYVQQENNYYTQAQTLSAQANATYQADEAAWEAAHITDQQYAADQTQAASLRAILNAAHYLGQVY